VGAQRQGRQAGGQDQWSSAVVVEPDTAGRVPARAGGRWVLLVVGVGFVVALVTAVLVVNVSGRVGAALEASLGPPVTRFRTITATATTEPVPPPPPPAPEAMLLRGRPPSPVDAAEAACAPPLRAGHLRPQEPGRWRPEAGVAAEGEVDDAGARAEITTMMRRRFRLADPESAVRDALAVYDSARLREITGDTVVLRAGLAELMGTLGEPTLHFALTTPRPLDIGFGAMTLEGAGGEARTDGYRLSVVVLDEYRHEPPAVVAPVVFHELLHQNGIAYLPEEVINNVLDVRVTLELLRDAPEAYGRPTRSVRSWWFQVLLQLNTRLGTTLAVDRSDTDSVAPGFEGPAIASLGATLRRDEPDNLYRTLANQPTPGHPTLVEVLRMVAPPETVPADARFDQATIDLLEANSGVGLCDQLVAADVLGVVPRGTNQQRLAARYRADLAR
jgi:hypothetical protein